MKLEKVVPFGRSLDEYLRMFNLSNTDLQKNILGVGDGPASFNAEGTKLGYSLTSIDPIYQFSATEILDRFYQVVDQIIIQVENTPNSWVWTYHQSPQMLKKSRVDTVHKFIADYELGKKEGRYLAEELPNLKFASHTYDLALCSHLLFLYSDHLDYQFHLNGILEMLRVSQEVRIFPLLNLNLERSPHLEAIIQYLNAQGYITKIENVAYELQKGGNQMLVIHHQVLS
ncbi:SAM-dependent methyltransferase [Synechococcus sp. PCC 7502]|uniref:SAM-dependent methyltransferase n=1 Tax=Synechococcus sp. PCC 7502 TaxID=1173263 RepID=UPI001FF0465B|nr:SAM-dependent methyltransferase [Synechococcus sp. PCC 7502]